MSGGPTSERELILRARAGDPDAFGQLFRRHRDRLWAVAIRTLGDPEEAADALQDAMISAFRRAGSFRGDSAVTTWLHRIVVNACLDRLRRKAARPATAGGDQQALENLAVARDRPDPSADSDTSLDVMSALRMLDVPKDLPEAAGRLAQSNDKAIESALAIAGLGTPPQSFSAESRPLVTGMIKRTIAAAHLPAPGRPQVASSVTPPPVQGGPSAPANEPSLDRRPFFNVRAGGSRVPDFRGMTLNTASAMILGQ